MSYVEVARFSSRLEAEAIGHALDQHEVPFLVQSSDIGVFGPGHVGFTPSGVALCVPEEHLERVRELLTCVVPGTEGSEPIDPGELAGEELAAEGDKEG